MFKLPSLFIAGFFFLMIACGSNAENNFLTTNSDSLLPPVENRHPNSDFKPAFKGQTRIGGIKTKATYTVTKITSKLDRPWGIVCLPDGRFLITEKEGVMKIADKSGKLSDDIIGIPEVNSSGQG